MPWFFLFKLLIFYSRYSFSVLNFYSSAADSFKSSPSLPFSLLIMDYISKSSSFFSFSILTFFSFLKCSLSASSFKVSSFSVDISIFSSYISTNRFTTSWNIFSSVFSKTGCAEFGRNPWCTFTSLLFINCSIKERTSELLRFSPLRNRLLDGKSWNWPVGWLEWVRMGPVVVGW